MASGWNLWVWLQCIGVASRCCCKEIYGYPHNNRRAERAPHLSYSGEKSSSYIYICFLYIYIYIYVRTSCTRALRANVGPAG